MIPGQNIPLSSSSVELRFSTPALPQGYAIDLSAFLLAANGKVRGDADFVFFNQAEAQGRSVRLDVQKGAFLVDLGAIPPDIDRVVFAMTLMNGVRLGQKFDDLRQAVLKLYDAATGSQIDEFTMDTVGRTETALIMGEVYRRNGAWKFKAVGQGFAGGLKPLAELHGVEVGDDESSDAREPSPPAPPPKPPVNLSKISLDKAKPTISLEKRAGGDHGELLINLNWSRGSHRLNKVDLDIGCLYELASGERGGIQALGNSFGRLDQPPYIALDGDDRSGGKADGENIRVNGKRWSEIKRILVYAFIYEGAPNWSVADGVVTLRAQGQPDIEVKLDSHRNDRTMCAIAMIENQGGAVKITRLVEYHRGHQDMDRAHSWGLRWVAGSK